MRYDGINGLLRGAGAALSTGPIGLIIVEDDVEVSSTLRHHLGCGFRQLIVFAPPQTRIDTALEEQVLRVDFDTLRPTATLEIVNSMIPACSGHWLYYCYNAEYLFYPFCENRTVGEMVTFAGEERRNSILTYVVDLYAGDLGSHPDAVSIDDAHLDRSGYYALSRKDNWNNDLDRQHDFFGGLRWRFEEHIPKNRRKIDRIALFRAGPGLVLNDDHTLNEAEYNTYSCPWHHNMTAAICSFRTAKALKRNPGSTFDIDTFRWHNSVPFQWHSHQLLDFGLMEPGQWF